MTIQRQSCRASPCALGRALAPALVLFALAHVAACTPYYTQRAYVYRRAPDASSGQRYVHAPSTYGSGYYYDPYAAEDDGDPRGEPADRARPAAHVPARDHADVPPPHGQQ